MSDSKKRLTGVKKDSSRSARTAAPKAARKYGDLAELTPREVGHTEGVSVRQKVPSVSRSEQMLENILYASPVGISYFENGKIKWANQAMVEMFGFKRPADYRGKGPREFYASDEEYHRVRQLFYTSLSHGHLAQADSIFKRSDGSTFFGHIRISALDASNPRKGTIATIFDVSARRKAEEALRESEEQYRTLYRESTRAQELYRSLLNSCADAIVIYDMEGHAKYVSESFTQIFGWTEQELLDKRIPYVPDSERELTMSQIQSVITGATGRGSFETKRFSRDGSLLDVRISASRYHDHEGKSAGMLAIITDITQRKKAELALAQSEQQLRMLSARLLTAQENERKRVARELHDGIGQSLTALRFRLERAFSQPQTSPSRSQRESLPAMLLAIRDLIEEVHKISMDLRPSVLDDLGILATITWFLREFQATYSGIQMEKHVQFKEDEVAEPLKIVIFRVLQEAFNNIAKHSKADRVYLSLSKTDQGIRLVIQDNGVGFERRDAFSTDSIRRGLGIASMKERTELSGGSFVLDAASGSGTTICASWPAGGPNSSG